MAIIKPSSAKQPMMQKVHKGKGGGKARANIAPWAKGAGKGGKGFKGGKGGQPAGVWTFIPAGAAAPMWGGHQVIQAFGKGGKHGKHGGKAARQVIQAVQQAVHMKGAGKGGKKGGKGKGKAASTYKFMDKLDTIDTERKVWVGGLPKDVTRGNIVEHFKTVCHPGVFEIMRGSACLSFKSAEDAGNVIASLNGSDMNGSAIQVDVWTQKEKKEKKQRPEGETAEGDKAKRVRGKKTKSGLMTTMLKNKTKPVDNKMKAKLQEVDHSLKVDLCDVMKPGTAVVTFKTEDEASSAVASMNGTELDDSALQVDVWTKPERREKKNKTAATEGEE